MTILNINLVNFVSESKSFDLNFDLFETNIINLAIVIYFLYSFGKGILNELLETRINSISKSLEDSVIKFNQASDSLLFAKNQVKETKNAAEKIQSQGKELAQKTFKKIIVSAEEEIKRLEDENLKLIKLEEEKCFLEVVSLFKFIVF
jgi:F-type H+-transporting ATPase subunit b